MMTTKPKTDRVLIYSNFVVVGYFALLGLLYVLKIETVLIGVLREMLTMPLLLAQVVLLVLGIINLTKNQRDTREVVSVVLLALCAVVTLGSFF